MDIVWQAEDSLREKKVESDLKDLQKTLVAFANSVAPGDTAKIFIGEKDDGTVQGVKDTDSIQKKIKKEADEIYPEIYYRTEVYERDGKQCVCINIKHNGLAPHFGGPAWVRRGSTTEKATEQLYQRMVELRQSKVHELAKWVGKSVTVSWSMSEHTVRGPNWTAFPCEVIRVTGHFCTFKDKAQGRQQSEPIQWLDFGWDDRGNCLQVYIDPRMKGRPPW